MELRTATAEDAVLGVAPQTVVSPGSVAEAAEALEGLAQEKAHLAFRGGGTELGLGSAPRRLDAVVSTHRMAKILEYAPADLVLTAEAGVTLQAIQHLARAHRQRLALDPPSPERATVGGLVSTGAFGPLRARHGAIRDLIIGATLIRHDGVLARSGGKVVKNVAGFDLPKLACGALGTLGMVASATFRLHPLPEASRAVLVSRLRAEQVVEVVAAMRGAQLEPSSLWALAPGDGGLELVALFEGFEQGVIDQTRRALELSAKGGLQAELLGEEAALGARGRHDRVRSSERFLLKLSGLPARFAALHRFAAPVLGRLHQGQLAWYPTVGAGFISGGVEDVGALAVAILQLRKDLGADGFAVLQAGPAPVRALVDVWGREPESFPLMRELKRRFDPEGRLNPGRFVGGL